MSLNAKGDKPEAPVEIRIKDLEAKLRKTRGANRKRAFAALLEADEKRAIEVVEGLAEAAAGKVRAELGALLASTGQERLVQRAVSGRWGDVVVGAVAPAPVVLTFIERFDTGFAKLAPPTVERAARALGLVPLEARLALGPGSNGARALVKMVDDERLARELRVAAARSLADVEPWAIWARREDLPVELTVAAGLASRVALPTPPECAAFCAAVSSMSAGERRRCIEAARLPSSALRLPPDVRVPLLALVLDDDGAPPADRAAAAMALVAIASEEGDEAVIARPRACVEATVAACVRIDVHEARAVLTPLLRESAEARAAFATSALAGAPAFLDDAVAMLTSDPLAAAAALTRSRDPRALVELLGAIEHADTEAAKLLVLGAFVAAVDDTTRALRGRVPLGVVLDVVTTRRTQSARAIEMLERLRTKPGVVTDDVDAALARLRAR